MVGLDSIGSMVVSPNDIRAAAGRIAGIAARTPALSSRALDALIGARVLLKPEVLQHTGSFKFRGALNRISTLTDEQRERGVIAFSSGNHGQAVALACALRGIAATVVLPADAPATKVEATRDHGAEILTYDRLTEDREAIARRLATERGLTLVAPFDDPDVIAGQGTAALELLDDAGSLDLLIAPVGGGGLIAGCAIAVHAVNPDARIVGVEPVLADDYRRSLAAGERVRVEPQTTLADALGAPMPGKLTFAINRGHLHSIVTASDAELVGAMRFAFEHLKLVLEPSGAAALAGLLSGRIAVAPGDTVGVILSGGNVDPASFLSLLSAP